MSICRLNTRTAKSVFALLASAITLPTLSGCAFGTSATSVPEPFKINVTLSGGVMGGQQPIAGSVIGLYVAGVTGYGSFGSNLVTTPVSTSAGGSFSIKNSYTCPSSTSQLYITATGGDPTGGTANNPAIELVAALGPCSGVSSSTNVNINEVTTVAAAFALGQFFSGFGTSPSSNGTTLDAFGTTSTNINGLIDAFATAHNLANVASGSATPTTAASGTNYFMTSLDQEKLYTMANIISDCVNQTTNTGNPCSLLFSSVTPYYAPMSTTVAATAPTDVLQAAVYLSLNPTSNSAKPGATSTSSTNMTALLNLQTPFKPFAPALTSATTDWTLALQYTGNGINDLDSVAVDAEGDLWFSNGNAYSASTPTYSGVVQMNGGTGNHGGTYGTTGGVIGFYTGDGTNFGNAIRQVGIDQAGNAWWGGYSTDYIFETASGGATTSFALTGSGYVAPYAIGVDGNDIVTVSTGGGNLVTFNAAATTPVLTKTPYIVNNNLSTGSFAFTQGTSSILAYAPAKSGAYVSEFTSGLTPVDTPATLATETTAGMPITATGISDGISANYGAAIDSNNNVWIANNAASGAIATGSQSSFTTISNSCLVSPEYLAVDGGNNIWVASYSPGAASYENSTSTTTFTGLCEFNNAGTLISSSVGYGPHNVNSGRGIAIDLAGNIWLTSYYISYSYVTEIVGAAVPVVAPLSVALKNSTVGTRP